MMMGAGTVSLVDVMMVLMAMLMMMTMMMIMMRILKSDETMKNDEHDEDAE